MKEVAALVELGHVPPGQRIRGAVEVTPTSRLCISRLCWTRTWWLRATRMASKPAWTTVNPLTSTFRAWCRGTAPLRHRSAFPAAPCGANVDRVERVAASAGTAPASANAVAPAAISPASHLDVCRIRQPPWRVTFCRLSRNRT